MPTRFLFVGYFLRALAVLTEVLRPVAMGRPLVVEEVFFDCVKLEPANDLPILASFLRTLEAVLDALFRADLSASFTVILPHTGGVLIVRYFIRVF